MGHVTGEVAPDDFWTTVIPASSVTNNGGLSWTWHPVLLSDAFMYVPLGVTFGQKWINGKSIFEMDFENHF